MANTTNKKKVKIMKDETPRNKQFEKLLLKSQKRMKSYVTARLLATGSEVTVADGFVYKKGTFPVLLVAHMDTVHDELPRTFVYANGTISSPQGIGGDDRCGIYMIFKILEHFDCHVVFTEDEEIGCVGAKKFAKTKECKEMKGNIKFVLELDRKGGNHAVSYQCDNKEFDDFITKEYFHKEKGTSSDICHIAPEIGVAAMNLSCGYYDEHHIRHYVVLDEMEIIIDEIKKILERTKELKESFEYIKSKSYGYGYGSGYYYNSWYDEDDYYYRKKHSYMFTFIARDAEIPYQKQTVIDSYSMNEAYFNFFKLYNHTCYADIISAKFIN